MSFKKVLSLLLALFSVVQCMDMCHVSNHDRLTSEARKAYKLIATGADGKMEPLDPIRVDKIVGEALGVKYTVTNATMTELKNCEIIKSECNKQESSFEFKLLCPQLVLYIPYEVKGVLGNVSLDGQSEEKITLDDYEITFKGKYEIYVSETDKKRRGMIKSYVIDTEPRGKLIFEHIKLIRGDKKKVETAYKYINENWRKIEKLMKSPTIETFMKSVVDKLNVYMKDFPLEDMISQE